jgi:ADP-heptose:LPS heptosyltransferase
MKSAAIVRADHIGDMVLTTPMIRALAEAGWQVDVIAPPAPLSLLRQDRRVRNLVSLAEVAPHWPRGWWALTKYLQRANYDAVILPYSHPRQLVLATAFSGARHRIAMWGGIPARVLGLTGVRSGYLDEPRPYAQTILRALAPLGIQTQSIEPELFFNANEQAEASRLLDAHLPAGIRVGIHPLCLGNTCNLPPATYAELARLVLDRTDWSIVLTGTARNRERIPQIESLVKEHGGRVWAAFGQLDLRALAAVLARLDAFVVPSTGPLHMARAAGTPTLTPFCPQIPVCGGIWGHAPLAATVIEPAQPPCNPTELHKDHCDFRGTITAEDLFRRLAQIVPGDSSTARSAVTP